MRAARPSLQLQCLGASGPCGSRGCPAPGRLGRDLWGGLGQPPEASVPASSPRFPRTRGAASQGPRRTRQGAGPERPWRRQPALDGSRAPGWLSLRPGDSEGKAGPEPGRRTLAGGDTLPAAKAPRPRRLVEPTPGPAPVSRTRSGGCGSLRGPVFVVSLFPAGRGHGAASGPHITHTHLARELSEQSAQS